jgi:hypothetical protein
VRERRESVVKKRRVKYRTVKAIGEDRRKVEERGRLDINPHTKRQTCACISRNFIFLIHALEKEKE